MKALKKKREKKSYEELLAMNPLEMTPEEYWEMTKYEQAENEKLTEKELRDKYRVW